MIVMKNTRQFSITLSKDLAEEIKRKVESGAYGSLDEVVREGVRALLHRDAAIDRWLAIQAQS